MRIEANVSPERTEAANVLVHRLFMHEFPPVRGLEIASAHRLAYRDAHVGGDLIDVYEYDEGIVALSVADISGKGPPAATLAALVKYGLRAYASAGFSPAEVLRNLNRLYLDNVRFEGDDPGSFVTAFFAIIDPWRWSMTYACGGHDPILLISPNRPPEFLPQTGPVLGAFEECECIIREKTVDLEPGAEIVVATDGVTESRGADGALLGRDALCEVLAANRAEPPATQVRLLLDLAENHAGGMCEDDMAVLVVNVTD